MDERYFADETSWKKWLRANHAKSEGIWLILLKGKQTEQTLTHASALDEALCWGWIDSLIRRLDEKRYVLKFTPRGPKSKWSAINKARVAELIADGRMMPPGQACIDIAHQNGSWDAPTGPPVVTGVPPALIAALEAHPAAKACFDALPKSHQREYILWIGTAKRADTIERRVNEAVERLEAGKQLGLR